MLSITQGTLNVQYVILMFTKYSPKPIKADFSTIDGIKFLVTAGLIVWFMFVSTGRLDYNWQWYRIPKYLFIFIDGSFVAGPLLDGILITLKITAISLVISSSFGLVTALFRLSDSFAARTLSRIYMELVRNTPLLVQIFFIYFVISPVLGFGRFTAAVLALSFFEGAYASEIFRAGILFIHKGQWEASAAVGFSRYQQIRHIIFPQAAQRILPPLAGQFISTIKDSSIVSVISIQELTFQGMELMSATLLTFEVWITVMVLYFLICLACSLMVEQLEVHMKKSMA